VQTTTYAYNSQGLLTCETFSDGTFQAYTYNAQGELSSAQAINGGITTYAYDAAGELTSVTNPSGQVESTPTTAAARNSHEPSRTARSRNTATMPPVNSPNSRTALAI
jgi:YD repeat-containing protein